jgi:hypothetical protein
VEQDKIEAGEPGAAAIRKDQHDPWRLRPCQAIPDRGPIILRIELEDLDLHACRDVP